ncbi:MAG TPA: TauD/TfdA family dioxygenase [Mycobacterium sp.]|nr:TauD/TfdA family dioxygenase [Mycobacterium sp.]
MSADEILAAARAVTVTFQGLPDVPLPLANAQSMGAAERQGIADRYDRHGFVVMQLPPGTLTPDTVLALAAALGLGEPLVPVLYRLNCSPPNPVARISAALNAGTADAGHPSFGRTVNQQLHCDGTLQDIGYVKASLLLCACPAAHGGDTLLFNASAAYAELASIDVRAAAALATPGALIRQANINNCDDLNAGPAFAVQDGRLVCRYCVTETDRWAVPRGATAADLQRGVDFLRAAALPGSPHFAHLRLEAGQAILLDNTRISHGRTAYKDSPTQQRCLYRSLHVCHPGGSTLRERGPSPSAP